MASQTAKQFVGAIDSLWASKNDILFDPQYLPDMYQVFGQDGLYFVDMLRIFNKRNMPVANATINHIERYALPKPIKLADNGAADGISAGAAGADITFKLDAANYDTNNRPPVQVTDHISIPAKYMQSGVTIQRAYRISSVAGTGNNLTFTAQPLQTTSQIATAVPIGTELMVGNNSFAPGTGQPSGMQEDYARRQHKAVIMKSTLEMAGGEVARAYREAMEREGRGKGGKNFLLGKEAYDTERRHDLREEFYMLLGEDIDNAIVQTDKYGTSQSVTGGKGFITWMEELAQSYSYFGEWAVDDFDALKPIFHSQGIQGCNIWLPSGPNFYTYVENSNLDFIREFSNTNLYKEGVDTLNMPIKHFYKNGFTYICHELGSFTNPNMYNLPNYPFADLAMAIPLEMASVRKDYGSTESITVPNVMIGYVNNNGENRSRIIGPQAGVNGMGYPMINQYDAIDVYILSHLMLIAVNVNKNILITKED